MRAIMRRSVMFAAFAALLSACARAGQSAAPANVALHTAQFDWFEYSGRDSVYDAFPARDGEYQNPILAGFYPDPAITRVGDDFYLVNSTFVYFPGIPVFHSRDLVNWTQLGNVIDRPTQLNFDTLGISRGVFAPTIEHHGNTFYVLNTCVDCGGNFIVTATNPAGPWSDPVWLREVDGIDPSIFFDDDGKAYVLNNGAPIGTPLYDGHRAIWIQEFDATTLMTFGPRTLIVNGGVDLSKKPIWIEGPHLFRKDGWYYLTAAEGGTAEGHSQVVLRSRSVRGPFEPFAGNPILTQRQLPRGRRFPVTSAGHANLVTTPQGDWWAIFLATRPYAGDFYNAGRETYLLPVTWKDGWPSITTDTQAVPYVHRTPAMAAGPAPAVPTHGNFTLRDEFNGPALAPYWNLIRTPTERWYDFSSARGALTVKARHVDLGAFHQPTFIGRRQQHTNATATVAMRYQPTAAGDRAGLTAFQNDEFYYLLAETLVDGKPVVQLTQRAGKVTNGSAHVIASAPLMGAGQGPLYLRIVARGAQYDFYYATAPDAWQLLKGDLDGTILSTKVASGFVGTMFGMYAYSATP
jgi:alpha-N-arabinofuranosidase